MHKVDVRVRTTGYMCLRGTNIVGGGLCAAPFQLFLYDSSGRGRIVG